MENVARLEAVILDMDGVVTDTAKVHARAWKRLFDGFLEAHSARTGTPFEPFDAVRDYLDYVDGKPRYEGVRSFLASRGIALPEGGPEDGPEATTVVGLGNRKDAYFAERLHADGVEVFEGTVERVREVRSLGASTALVTSSKHGREVLALAGLEDLFDVRLDGNDIETLGLKGKPNPDLFLEAASRLDVPPARAAVVEDAVSGVQAGRAGGFGLVIGVNRGANREALERGGGDVVVDDLAELSAEEILTPLADLPSALERLPELARRLAGRRAVVFLDYDGTLTPIVAHPDLAVLAPDAREALRHLARVATVAVVSGRALADVRALVALDDIVYAGNHGFEIQGPGGTALSYEVGGDFLDDVARVREVLAQRVEPISGAWVEDKARSLSVHYRQTPEERVADVEAAVDAALADAPRLRKHHGKMVFEIRPRIDWDKGRAVLWLLEALGLEGPEVLPFYLGDDVTDEDAFRALAGRGVGVLVAEAPRASAADYRLGDPDEVRECLAGLASRLEEVRE
jgi:trehalose 6-phosphate phosphatase